jgi:hypothetical protein
VIPKQGLRRVDTLRLCAGMCGPPLSAQIARAEAHLARLAAKNAQPPGREKRSISGLAHEAHEMPLMNKV